MYALRRALPDTFTVQPGQTLAIASMPWLSAQPGRAASGEVPASAGAADGSQTQTLALFDLIPVKTVRTVAAERRSVVVCGTPFGVKMFSNGALVVAFSDLYTSLGSENPAKEAGLRLGDLIVSAGGRTVRSNDELSAAITAAAGGPMEVVYLRDGARCTCTLTPVQDQDGSYKAGIWVRDSSAGIGTLTFADTQNGTFAGLGHAISDTDTGASILYVYLFAGHHHRLRGRHGRRARRTAGRILQRRGAGTVLANDATGVYGRLTGSVEGAVCPVANSQEVKPGAAQILATIDGGAAKLYDVRIERVDLNAADPNRNMLIRITDPELLAATGGIVQGMSGSPLLQDGMLVGAVTHVLVNDPARGYAIFAQTMLAAADAAAAQS